MNDVSSLKLEIKNLSVAFNQGSEIITAVENISFNIYKGSTVGVVGESGSGKSVTALAIMGLLPEYSSHIINGEIIFHLSESDKINILNLDYKSISELRGNRISMIFQEPMTSLNPVMKCGKQVMEVLLAHKNEQIKTKKQAKKYVTELFKEVELPRPEQIYNSYPHQLSGGQKQRVMIAMAIACKPELLIADEPTTALDVTIQKTILELLKKLQQKYGMSMLFITHDLSIISGLADQIVIMHKGTLVESGDARKIFDKPEAPYTKGLLACRPPLDKRLKALPTIDDFINNNKDSYVTDKDKFFEISNDIRTENLKKIYSNPPVLSVEGIITKFKIKQGFFSKKKDFVNAVDNVNFKVHPGETLGLVGESGCGKTTLGRTILRLVESEEGKIIFKGTDLKTLNNKELRRLRKEIQIVFQDPYSSLNPRLTIGNAIIEPMKVHHLYGSYKNRKDKAIELLKQVGLSSTHFNRYPHEFSGGQRQRICIARALALSPSLIICDESVSALDVSVQAQVLNLLNTLKENFGFTYIFISHDLSVVRYMSDRIAVMKNGKICEIGEADSLFNNPADDYTRNLINAIPGN